MSRQDKATTDRNAKLLRELVKQPDNKSCADCRKNDARWASWNLGVFLCIRCSGIHRSMGTHISKVKSIDLDIWQPEQMESIQKWGNHLANLYWECHLKAGHVPAEHKIESFIRSKYETKRWAMDGPPPADPRVLENGAARDAPAPPTTRPTPTSSAPPPAASIAPKTHPLLSRTSRSAASTPAPTAAVTRAPAPVIDLFGQDEPPSLAPAITTAPSNTTAMPSSSVQTSATAPPAPTPNSMFDLDFRAPQQAKPSAKADIMSLFSTAPTPTTGAGNMAQSQGNGFGNWNGGITSSNTTQFGATQTPLPAVNGGWGGEQSAWGAPAGQPSIQPTTNTIPNSTSTPWGGVNADPWQSSGGSGGGGGFVSPPIQKKDDKDPFANLWN